MNADFQNIEQFSTLADSWWDHEGSCKPLHQINPHRLQFIEQHSAPLREKKVLDIGCGGGILTESLAKKSATCMGIDLSEPLIRVADLHAKKEKLSIDYQKISVEELARTHAETFDIITCMELLEHVPDPESIIQSCSALLKPGGHLFLSTLNRKPKSFLLGIVVAEYLLGILPQGTHTYAQFIRPSELCASVRRAGLDVLHLSGMDYNPLTRYIALTDTIDIHYLLHAQKRILPAGAAVS
jgi:2-polyprenyl-6-hydroxyphenyl methylase/3-demethylubiquinone-9 3-methyltransferase